jgi:hypothetical protein
MIRRPAKISHTEPYSFQWTFTQHCCRVCFGRVLMRTTVDARRIYRCADCGVEREGHDERAICSCGIKLRTTVDAGIRCKVNEKRTPECPSEIVAEQLLEGDTGVGKKSPASNTSAV